MRTTRVTAHDGIYSVEVEEDPATGVDHHGDPFGVLMDFDVTELTTLHAQIGAVLAADPRIDTDAKLHHDAHDTEVAAARFVQPRTGSGRWKVLSALAGRGLTDEELAVETGLRHYTAAPRRNELCEWGFVEDSGDRRQTTSGSLAIVWRLSETGRVWWQMNGASHAV